MKSVCTKTITLALMATMWVACGPGKKEAAGTLNEKKAELEKLRTSSAQLMEKISTLEAEIAKMDTAAAAVVTAKLVSAETLTTQNFSHFIELQGRVDAENISYVSPRGAPGQIKEIFVRKGDMVSKGQIVLKLDDRIIRQQREQLYTQLNFAKDLLKRREDLWKQNIGSEVELLSARNSVDQVQRQLETLNEQLDMANVKAEVSGMVDDVTVRVGEIFQGGPQIRIVNLSSLKVVTDVPENYLDKVGRGSKVEVVVPDINRTFQSSISFVGASINPNSRGFSTEAKLPSDKMLKPNQIAMVRILDYSAPNAVVVPVNVVQSDEKGKYVFVMSKEGADMVARKKPIAVGMLQGNMVEIKSGLAAGDQLITEGFQSLYDGQKITTTL